MADPRTTFFVPDDRQVVVYFEWEGPRGTHHCEGTLRGPNGQLSVMSSFDYPATQPRFGGFWAIPAKPRLPDRTTQSSAQPSTSAVIFEPDKSAAVAKGIELPSPCHGARHAFFRVGGRSIDGDASGGRSSFDFRYWRSRADGIVTGRPKFEIKHTFVGFAIGRDDIRFVDGEDG